MAIKYFERRKQEAEDTLRKLREFYSEENDPYNRYCGERRTVNSGVIDKGTGEENPVKSLRKIKPHFSYNIGILLDRQEKFGGVYEYVNDKERQQKSRTTTEERFKSDLESWIGDAIPILGRIIAENPDQMDGFKYKESHAQYGHDENEIKNVNGEIQISRTGYDFGHAVYHEMRKKPCSRIALEALNDTTYPKDHVIEWYLHPGAFKLGDVDVGKLRKSNRKRNQLVREIEKRTGRNLKREVYEARRRREEQ